MTDYSHYSAQNERTAGYNKNPYKSVQAWKTKKSHAPQPVSEIKSEIVGNLEKASKGQVGSFDAQLETTMAYADPGTRIENEPQGNGDSYEFHDVVDVINPLHHLPIVGMVYRGLTGDTLHPMSQIIGGALYGGPIGAVTGTINAISQVQTGKDLSDHALGFAGLGPDTEQTETDFSKYASGFTGVESNKLPDKNRNNPEAQLNDVANALKKQKSIEEIPGNTLSFVNLAEPNRAYKHIEIAEGRTAGKMMVKKASYRQVVNPQTFENSAIEPPKANLDNLPDREQITTVTLSSMPPRKGS